MQPLVNSVIDDDLLTPAAAVTMFVIDRHNLLDAWQALRELVLAPALSPVGGNVDDVARTGEPVLRHGFIEQPCLGVIGVLETLRALAETIPQ